ncbi:MAG: hypothetical protein PHP59_03660 [Methanofollis sp.]|uniref:hypothetical protein n=1 Tax=Methanofollis sp. TaxID=2052835 RepID=UPI002607B652|nr:hypothetical protein [Methanofollis sp.]MDD4254452.1 hypothetical protein [Methanofollis sp.]
METMEEADRQASVVCFSALRPPPSLFSACVRVTDLNLPACTEMLARFIAGAP